MQCVISNAHGLNRNVLFNPYTYTSGRWQCMGSILRACTHPPAAPLLPSPEHQPWDCQLSGSARWD